MTRAVAVLAVLLIIPATGCAGGSKTPQPLRWAWRPVTLPVPPGPSGRLTVRDATGCGGRWYVVGAVTGADGATRPAAWTSPDGLAWQPLATAPRTGYGAENILYAAGCRDGALAAIGAKSGGAHGNPRVSTWRMTGPAGLTEQTAEFPLYGGPEAINVGRIAGGPGGWLIAGNRTSGAAVWTADPAGEFNLRAGVTDLATDERGVTWASDAAATDRGWIVVGALTPTGVVDRDPVAWRSVDGSAWTRERINGGTGNEELQRVVPVGDGVLAAGPHGDAFAVWRSRIGDWTVAGRFGHVGGTGVPEVRAFAVLDAALLLAVVDDGAAPRVYSSTDAGDSWAEVSGPAGDWSPAAAVGAAGRWVVFGADGRAWQSPHP